MDGFSNILFSGDFILYLVGPVTVGLVIHGIIESLAKKPAE